MTGHFFHAGSVWEAFQGELACVDEEHLKRAFRLVWDVRGDVDKAAANVLKHDHTKLLRRLDELDKPPWD